MSSVDSPEMDLFTVLVLFTYFSTSFGNDSDDGWTQLHFAAWNGKKIPR